MQGKAKENTAFRLRLEATNKLLDRQPTAQKGDDDMDDENAIVVTKQRDPRRTISHEMVAKIEDIALVSEGSILYKRNDYYRAIEAFSKVIDKNKDNLDVLINRANCYIQIGRPEDALTDIDQVLHAQPKNPHAILAKAEAYFSMGEFEFALVFFQKGFSERRDMIQFVDGITKSKHAILDSIRGEQLFQPNPLFAASRKRVPLVEVKQTRAIKPADEQKLHQTQLLLPEKVTPLGASVQDKKSYLGELALDYDYLIELREDIIQHLNDPSNLGKKEDENVLRIVEDAIAYLDQRAAFWYQQASGDTAQNQLYEEEEDAPQSSKPTSRRPKTTSTTTRTRAVQRNKTPLRTVKTPRRTGNGGQAHYEMSKMQQYEMKYGANAK